MSHDAANSFKIKLSLGDAEEFADAQFWPHDIYCRRWRNTHQRQNEVRRG